MSLYSYAHDGLDLALALRAWISTGKPVSDILLSRLETLVGQNSIARASDRRSRTGHALRADEDELQALIVATLRADPLVYTPGRAGIVAVHGSPLGRWRSKMDRVLAARAGSSAGWPDLDIRLVDVHRRPRSLLVELKTSRGRESRDQVALRDRLLFAGFECRVARGLRGFVDTLCEAFGTTKSEEVPF